MRTGPRGGILKVLSEDELDKLHLASLTLLKDHGMRIDSERALKLFKENGAEVDFDRRVVKVPESLVEESIRKAPKSILLAGRDQKNDFILEDKRVYFGPGTGVPFIRDLTGERRTAVTKDVVNCAKIVDALPNIDFAMGMVGPLDAPKNIMGLIIQEALMLNTTKHVVLDCDHGVQVARYQMKMAELIAGGREELLKRPLVSMHPVYSPPFVYWKNPVEVLIEWAEAGLPIIGGGGNISGANAPITLAGSIIQANAQGLMGNLIVQLVNPGSPYIYYFHSSVLDMRTAVPTYAKPEIWLMETVMAQLSHYYGFPNYGTGGCSDSKTLDGQSIIEASMTLAMSALSGHGLIHDCGYLESGKSASLVLLVICDEIAAMLRRVFKGIQIDDETLAFNAIKEAGHGGHFIGLKHTRDHFASEHILLDLMNYATHARWKEDGEKKLEDVARERAKKILKEHHVEPLPDDIRRELSEMVSSAQKSI